MKTTIFIFLLTLSAFVNPQQKIIKLYNGAAPGSESWTWKKNTRIAVNMFRVNVVYNVLSQRLQYSA